MSTTHTSLPSRFLELLLVLTHGALRLICSAGELRLSMLSSCSVYCTKEWMLLLRHWRNRSPFLKRTSIGAVAVARLGFTWGGWHTNAVVERREAIAAIKALTPVCLENSSRAPDAQVKLVALKAIGSSWQRDVRQGRQMGNGQQQSELRRCRRVCRSFVRSQTITAGSANVTDQSLAPAGQ